MDARPDHSVSSTYTRTLGQTHKSLSVNLMAKRSLSQITNACIFIRTDRDNIQVRTEREGERGRERNEHEFFWASVSERWHLLQVCGKHFVRSRWYMCCLLMETTNNSNNKRQQQQQQTPPPFGLVIWYLCCRVARFVNADRQLSVCFMFIGMDLPQRCAFLLTNWLMTDTMEWDKARESCRGLTSQRGRGGKLCRQATSWE